MQFSLCLIKGAKYF